MLLWRVPGKNLLKISQPERGGGGQPPLNFDIVGANTTGEEITAQPLANHDQNAVK